MNSPLSLRRKLGCDNSQFVPLTKVMLATINDARAVTRPRSGDGYFCAKKTVGSGPTGIAEFLSDRWENLFFQFLGQPCLEFRSKIKEHEDKR